MTDYRSEFGDFGDVAYLDVCAEAPMPLISVRAAHAAVDWKKLPHTIPEGTYFDLPERVRNLLARLIGADPDEIGARYRREYRIRRGGKWNRLAPRRRNTGGCGRIPSPYSGVGWPAIPGGSLCPDDQAHRPLYRRR